MSNLAKIDQVTNLHRNNELQLLCFRLEKDKDLYAVNVFKIREVVKYRGNITVVSHEIKLSRGGAHHDQRAYDSSD